jgi:hypothetical protein
MTVATNAPAPVEPSSRPADVRDHRGSWLPTGWMIAARFNELRRRRGLMATLVVVTVGIPGIYLAIRLILHAVAPHSYGPAGGYDQYVGLVAGVLYVFGFIVAATLGATAGSADLGEGVFRHHVITGRSRVALYLARIPAGLGIIVPLVATGFAVVCAVCVFAAPKSLTYDGVAVPVQLSEPQFEHWAAGHAQEVIRNFPLSITPADHFNPACLPGGPGPTPNGLHKGPVGQAGTTCTSGQLKSFAMTIAKQDYSDYSSVFLSPSVPLMVKSGLWLELEACVGLLVGLGLSSLIGQRTIAVILLIVLEVIITPIASRAKLPHLLNLQRSIVGVATAHLEPGGLPTPFGGGPADRATFVHESSVVAVVVVVAWIVAWTVLGAWRMAKRDA